MNEAKRLKSERNAATYANSKLKQSVDLCNAIGNAKYVLLCLVTYSRYCFTLVVDHSHRAAQFILSPEACQDVLSNNKDVEVEYDGEQLSLVQLYTKHNLIPTYVVALVDALTIDNPIGSPLGVGLLKLTTGKTFWQDVLQSPLPFEVNLCISSSSSSSSSS